MRVRETKDRIGFRGEFEDAGFLVRREKFGVGFEDHADEGEGVDVFAIAFEAEMRSVDGLIGTSRFERRRFKG